MKKKLLAVPRDHPVKMNGRVAAQIAALKRRILEDKRRLRRDTRALMALYESARRINEFYGRD